MSNFFYYKEKNLIYSNQLSWSEYLRQNEEKALENNFDAYFFIRYTISFKVWKSILEFGKWSLLTFHSTTHVRWIIISIQSIRKVHCEIKCVSIGKLFSRLKIDDPLTYESISIAVQGQVQFFQCNRFSPCAT